MSNPDRSPLVIRIAIFVVLGGVAVALGMRIMSLLDAPPSTSTAAPRKDELAVAEAIGRQPTKPVIVRGYVFANDGFPVRVCNGIKRTSPPSCVGPFLELRNLDPSRVPVRQQRDDTSGRDVIWSPEPVALLGDVAKDRFLVRELLN